MSLERLVEALFVVIVVVFMAFVVYAGVRGR